VNQIGTLTTKRWAVSRPATRLGAVMSHRSGETGGFNHRRPLARPTAVRSESGSLSPPTLAKHNQLLRIEGSSATLGTYAGGESILRLGADHSR
jgi:enolase